jgi:hypothetical protein
MGGLVLELPIAVILILQEHVVWRHNGLRYTVAIFCSSVVFELVK